MTNPSVKQKVWTETRRLSQSYWAVSVVRYGAGVVSWTKMELWNVDRSDRKTRKLITIYGMLHPRGDVDRLYLPREIGRRGLMGVEDCVRLEEIKSYYVRSSERLLEAVIPEGILRNVKSQSPKEVKNRNCKERFESWKSKPLHGQILRQTGEFGLDFVILFWVLCLCFVPIGHRRMQETKHCGTGCKKMILRKRLKGLLQLPKTRR